MAIAIQAIIETLVILLIAYGIWHEQELIELEDVLWQWAKRGFKKGKGEQKRPKIEIIELDFSKGEKSND